MGAGFLVALSLPPWGIWPLAFVGVMLFEALAGRPPFDGTNLAEIGMKILRDPTPRLSLVRRSLPREFDDIVQRALAKDASSRFDSAIEMLRAILACAPPEADDAPSSVSGSLLLPRLPGASSTPSAF